MFGRILNILSKNGEILKWNFKKKFSFCLDKKNYISDNTHILNVY